MMCQGYILYLLRVLTCWKWYNVTLEACTVELTTRCRPRWFVGPLCHLRVEKHPWLGLCFAMVGELKVRKCYLYFWPLQIISFTWKLLLLNDDQEVNFAHWWIKSLFPAFDAFFILYAMVSFLSVLEHTAW